MNTDACCAHCKVVLKHIDHPGGTRSDYWECADGCGCKFWPESHTAKAVEELQQKLTVYEGQTKFYCECGGVRQREEELQKQCESLQEDANRDALQYEGKCTEILVLQDQCDDLRTRADEQRIKIMELDRALDTMHQRAEKAEAAHDELQKHVLFLNELKTKAEAEVHQMHIKANESCAELIKAQVALVQLQQDVRPLVEYIALQEWPTARKTLEAFLAKHPELK